MDFRLELRKAAHSDHHAVTQKWSRTTRPKYIHINWFGIISKKHPPGKWRLVADLPFPEGHGVRSNRSEPCSMLDITVEEVARVTIADTIGMLIAKIDIKSAYLLVPVWRYDRKWIGMRWKDQINVDGMLPFGLRLAPNDFLSYSRCSRVDCYTGRVRHMYILLPRWLCIIGPPD